MKAKSHKILDHPILGYFILFIFALIFSNLGSTIDGLVAPFIPGYSNEVVTPQELQPVPWALALPLEHL